MTKTPTEPIAREHMRAIFADAWLTRIPLMDVQKMVEKGTGPAEAIAYLSGSKNAFIVVANLSRLSESLRHVSQDIADCYELVIRMVERHGLESAQAEIAKLPKTRVAPVVVEA